jgi:hypothetical protein
MSERRWRDVANRATTPHETTAKRIASVANERRGRICVIC